MVINNEVLKTYMLKFLPLVDTYYDMGETLEEAYFKCFRVEDILIRYFCGDDLAYSKEREFHILDTKCSVSLGSYKGDYVNTLYNTAHDIAEKKGHDWLSSPSPFWQSYMKNEHQNPHEHNQIMQDFLSQERILWQKEVESFSTGAHKKYNNSNPQSWIDLVKDIASENSEKLGFKIDNKLSGDSKLVYLKSINKNWSIYLAFDLHHLKLKFKDNHPVNNFIESYFGLIQSKNKKHSFSSKYNVKSLLNFRYFFPIGIVNEQYMCKFSNLEELEVIINMYYKLYIILKERGFESIAKRAVPQN